MTDAEQIARFIAEKGVTKCPSGYAKGAGICRESKAEYLDRCDFYQQQRNMDILESEMFGGACTEADMRDHCAY